jgi:hypothetical protein
MVKFWTSFLNLAFLACLLSSCREEGRIENLSLNARKKLSVELLNQGENQYPQGSPDNMNLIEMAIEADPKNSAALRELSVPYLKRGLPHEWKPLFDKAVDVDPVSWQGWRGYLKLFFYRDYEGAIQDLNATDTLTPNFTDYPQSMSVDYLRGLAHLGLKNYPAAKTWMSKYINEVTANLGEPWVDVNAFLYRGLINEHLDENDSAFQDLVTHLKYYNNSADGHYHLARIELKKGNIAAANDHAANALPLFKKGYYMSVNYVETFEQIYLSDIENLQKKIDAAKVD